MTALTLSLGLGLSVLLSATLSFSAPRASRIDGGDAACAVTPEGSVKCWRVGLHPLDGSTPTVMRPYFWGHFSDAIQVSLKSETLRCVLHRTGEVSCSGYLYASKPDGSVATSWSKRPRKILGLNGITQIAAGSQHLCALRSDGRVLCWGENHRGQAGHDPLRVPTLGEPTLVPGLFDVAQISVGFDFTCAVKNDGSALCWGNNAFGTLGNGTRVDAWQPQRVLLSQGARSIHAGGENTCAILLDGTAQCWGVNQYGQLGNGTISAPSAVPVSVKDLAHIVDLNVGHLTICAILEDTSAACWGHNTEGQIGYGVATPQPFLTPSPVGLPPLTPVTGMTGGMTKCALVGDRDIYCWGVMSEDDDMHLPFDSTAVPTIIGTL